jgi:4-hydroxythreonine-4-phosphate dehydrogenase
VIPLPRIAVTSGEPAGIGPDLCVALAQAALPCDLVCLADRELLAARARLLGARPIAFTDYAADARRPHRPGALTVLHCPLRTRSEAGRLEVRNAPAVLEMIDRAVAGCLAGEFDAMVTAPVQKSCILDSGVAFVGHTEYLAERTRAPRPVMMLAAGSLRVALATTHIPLKLVSEALSPDGLAQVLEILHRDLGRWWRLPAPRIAVCGLNPHAGESGHLGREEIDTLAPASRPTDRSRPTRSSCPSCSSGTMPCSRCITIRACR